LMDTQSRVCYTAGGTTAADERKSARSGRKIGFPASGSQPMWFGWFQRSAASRDILAGGTEGSSRGCRRSVGVMT
jgi:hypothetical protein